MNPSQPKGPGWTTVLEDGDLPIWRPGRSVMTIIVNRKSSDNHCLWPIHQYWLKLLRIQKQAAQTALLLKVSDHLDISLFGNYVSNKNDMPFSIATFLKNKEIQLMINFWKVYIY